MSKPAAHRITDLRNALKVVTDVLYRSPSSSYSAAAYVKGVKALEENPELEPSTATVSTPALELEDAEFLIRRLHDAADYLTARPAFEKSTQPIVAAEMRFRCVQIMMALGIDVLKPLSHYVVPVGAEYTTTSTDLFDRVRMQEARIAELTAAILDAVNRVTGSEGEAIQAVLRKVVEKELQQQPAPEPPKASSSAFLTIGTRPRSAA